MARLTARKTNGVQNQIKGLDKHFDHHRIRYIGGTGRIMKTTLVEVSAPDAPPTGKTWVWLILATGSRWIDLPDLPVDGRGVLSSKDALALERVPPSILIVSGGVIGCQFAQICGAGGAPPHG
jgi:dihydrolipoamide dehydrogenase